jgi:uroporphyrin-III C-methyltransferase/precorrin-2 dehydrogenase/sirohydrochlorin ferrochelatase
MSGHVTFLGSGPGEADLITVRGLRALQAADVVMHDALIDTTLLDGLKAEIVNVGKRCGRHSMQQEQINETIAEQALAGHRVVRLKGGDPSVLARLGEEALHVAARGVSFDIVPGVSSVTAAGGFAGIPLTHRGIADSFCVLTAHKKDEERSFSIPNYDPSRTIVLLMGLLTTPQWSEQMIELGYPDHTPVAFVASAATERQQVLIADLASAPLAVRDSDIRPPAIAIVGGVVKLHEKLKWFEPSSEAGQNAGSAA